jgi:hypothetical protein
LAQGAFTHQPYFAVRFLAGIVLLAAVLVEAVEGADEHAGV